MSTVMTFYHLGDRMSTLRQLSLHGLHATCQYYTGAITNGEDTEDLW